MKKSPCQTKPGKGSDLPPGTRDIQRKETELRQNSTELFEFQIMSQTYCCLHPIRKDTVQAKARLISKEEKKPKLICDFFNDQGKLAARAEYKYMLTEPMT